MIRSGGVLLSKVLMLSTTACAFVKVVAAEEFTYQEFYNPGVTYTEAEIPFEKKESFFKIEGSLPRSSAPERALHVAHPAYKLEIAAVKSGTVDGREHVRDTTDWPHSVFGQLSLQHGRDTYQGSGTLISPHHVITCAHNVFDLETQQWEQT